MKIDDEQQRMWSELLALHQAWIDRGVSLGNTLALYSTFLASTAMQSGLTRELITGLVGETFDKTKAVSK